LHQDEEVAMAKRDVEQENVRITEVPPPPSAIKKVDDVFIVVTQAFCPNNHNLVTDDNEKFDGYPGIRLKIVSGDRTGNVFLSPFHGDDSKKGDLDWEDGTRMEVRCPKCNIVLPTLAKCHCDKEGDIVKLYLNSSLNDSHILALCNVWGCRRSRTIDNWNIISEYFDGQISD
jgi:hypothetical protein